MVYKPTRGTAAAWAASSTVLQDGQLGLSHNTDGSDEIRVGNGTATWGNLPKLAGIREGQLLLNVASGLYGAFVGAGSSSTGTADIATINAALAAAEPFGATVLIPAHARVTVTAPSGGNLITARQNVTLKSEGAVIKIANSSPAYNAVINSSADVSGFVLDGITIDQNKDNVTAASLATNQYQFAVRIVVGTNIHIRNSTFKNCDGINTITLNGTSGTNGVINVGNVSVTNCVFDNIGTDNDHDHSTIYTVATSGTIEGNHFYGRSTVAKSAVCAIEVHGSSHRVTNNHIERYREAVNATGIAYQTDTQVVAHNTILRCMRGIRAFSQAKDGTVTPGIRAMQLSNNSIVLDPDFWAATHDVSCQGISFTSTQDLAVHGLNIQNNSITFLPYTGTSTNVANANSAGVMYNRSGTTTNPDRAIDIAGNTIIGALSAGVMLLGLYVRGMNVRDNIIIDPGHLSLVASDEYLAGVTLFGQAIATSVRENRVYDTRSTGVTKRGVAWFVDSSSILGEIVDNHVMLKLTSQREVRVNTSSGAPFVRHTNRTTSGNVTVPTGDCEVGSEWVVMSTGVRQVQRAAPSGAVWVSPTHTTAGRPSAASVGAGYSTFDSTLNKPIWSDGTNWKDATGTTV